MNTLFLVGVFLLSALIFWVLGQNIMSRILLSLVIIGGIILIAVGLMTVPPGVEPVVKVAGSGAAVGLFVGWIDL